MTKSLYFYMRLWVMHRYMPNKLKWMLRRQYTKDAERVERSFRKPTLGNSFRDMFLKAVLEVTSIANIPDDPARGRIPLRRYQRAVHAGLWKTKGIRLRPKLTIVYS